MQEYQSIQNAINNQYNKNTGPTFDEITSPIKHSILTFHIRHIKIGKRE